MLKIVPIVEGPGEVTAVPVLLQKLLKEMDCHNIQVAIPKNAHGRGTLEKLLEKFIQHAWRERDCGAILVLLDADKDCPKDLAKGFSRRIEAMGIIHPVVIVCAKHMYETWFLASLETIAGKKLGERPGLLGGIPSPEDVESVGGAKGRLSHHFPMGRAYKETEDQEAMTRLLNTRLARDRSRSFRRLWHAIEQALEAINTGAKIVTPSFPEEVSQLKKTGKLVTKRGSKRR
jgi:hypothetical protein